MRVETMEVVVTALEKSPNHYENAAKLIRDTMTKKFGDGWNAIVGEGYGFSISSHVKHLLFLFYGGTLAVLLYKGFYYFYLFLSFWIDFPFTTAS